MSEKLSDALREEVRKDKELAEQAVKHEGDRPAYLSEVVAIVGSILGRVADVIDKHVPPLEPGGEESTEDKPF